MTAEYTVDYNMADRITTVTGDHGKDEFGTGYDMIYESFAFGGDSTEITDYFSRIYSAMDSKGIVVSIRSLLDNSRNFPLSTLKWDLKIFINSGKNTYFTEGEFTAILEQIGFSNIEILDHGKISEMDFKIIVAEK